MARKGHLREWLKIFAIFAGLGVLTLLGLFGGEIFYLAGRAKDTNSLQFIDLDRMLKRPVAATGNAGATGLESGPENGLKSSTKGVAAPAELEAGSGYPPVFSTDGITSPGLRQALEGLNRTYDAIFRDFAEFAYQERSLPDLERRRRLTALDQRRFDAEQAATRLFTPEQLMRDRRTLNFKRCSAIVQAWSFENYIAQAALDRDWRGASYLAAALDDYQFFIGECEQKLADPSIEMNRSLNPYPILAANGSAGWDIEVYCLSREGGPKAYFRLASEIFYRQAHFFSHYLNSL